MNHRIISILIGVGIIATVVGGVVYWEWRAAGPAIGPPAAEAEPVITWAFPSISQEVGRGESKAVVVSFTASEDLDNIDVRVVPELQQFVQVKPTMFATVVANQSYSVDVVFFASTTSPIGAVDGTVQLRRDKTLARPLPITLLVTVVPLPPDPGEAGKVTLEGIDSDGDGVRDDVQRYIALTYPDSEKTRLALTQHAKVVTTNY